MIKDRYEFICMEIEAGRDAFAANPTSHEEGLVTQCLPDTNHLMIQTSNGAKRCWDYHECEELYRSNKEWPWR